MVNRFGCRCLMIRFGSDTSVFIVVKKFSNFTGKGRPYRYLVMYTKFRFVIALFVLLLLVACDRPVLTEAPVPAAEEIDHVKAKVVELMVDAVVEEPKSKPLDISPRDYSFGYWLNGMRKHADDASPHVLCLESGYAGFRLDLGDLGQARFGRFDQALSYTEALEAGATRLEQLKPVELAIELESKGRVFRAVSCNGGVDSDRRKLKDAWLWESGRMTQHYELLDLNFEDADGVSLACHGSLDIMMWPNSLTFTTELAPSYVYADGWHHGVEGNGLCVIEKPWKVPHDARLEPQELSVECWVKVPEELESAAHGYLLAKNGHLGTPGHYGFSIRHGAVTAHLNVARAAETRRSIAQRGRSFKANAWNHLVLTYDGVAMKFYINGVLQGTETVGQLRLPGNGALVLGQRADGHGGVTSALYDQVRVWNRALTQQEVQAHNKEPRRVGHVRALQYDENFDGYGANGVVTPEWSDVTFRIRLKGETESDTWLAEEQVAGVWELGEKKQLTLNCDFDAAAGPQDAISVKVSTPKDGDTQAVFDPAYNCYVAEVSKVTRDWKTGYTDIRNYDDFDVVVENTGETAINVPFLFYLRNPANITGMLPMLCDADGVPTGIPVQLSKNWHYAKLGAYLRGTMQLPVGPGESKTYKLRIAYGFYGTLPSVSHAQLSLVGYGGLGRWDQLAIGCWGETICFDMDMSCVDVAVTDVRMLMARNGKDGGKWNWTDAGWGGDWLCVNDAKHRKHYFSEMKTAYQAHGPCLSEVDYDGHYGSQREVAVQAKVQTLRTDDYARTFQTFKYSFDQTVSVEKGWLFKMGRTGGYVTPKVAYGNRDGLIQEHDVPNGLKVGDEFLPKTTLTGEGPWWVAFPGAYHNNNKDWGTGYRALVIRSYKAVIGGKAYNNPTVSFPAYHPAGAELSNLDCLLTAPAGVSAFNAGDSLELEVEWITLPRVADDYYGPNETFRSHVTDNPSSWKTTYREAIGNDLKVVVEGGTVLHNYPIIIQAEQSDVRVSIDGGVGYVPIRFEGLKRATGTMLYQIVDGVETALDQSVHGNDFWQTDYDAKTQSYQLTFNLPLNLGGATEWRLRSE